MLNESLMHMLMAVSMNANTRIYLHMHMLLLDRQQQNGYNRMDIIEWIQQNNDNNKKFKKTKQYNMGSSQSQPLSNQLQQYKIIQKLAEHSLTHLCHIETDKQYLLRELTYNQQSAYKKSLAQHQARIQLIDEHLTHLIKFQSKEYDHLCSNVYKIYGIWEYPYRNLFDQVYERSYQNRKFQEKEIWSILASCIFALNTLQKSKIRYEILTSKHILLDYSGVVKLADPMSIGSCTNLQILTRSRSSSNPQIYLSPEQCQSLQHHSTYNNPYKSDVYVLGMIILECGLLQQMNSCYKDQYQRIDHQVLQQKVYKFGEEYGQELRVFVESMLRRESQDRPDWIDLAQFARKFQKNTNNSYTNSPDKEKVSDISNAKLNLTPNSDQYNEQSMSLKYPSSNKNNSKFSNLSAVSQGQTGIPTHQDHIGIQGQQQGQQGFGGKLGFGGQQGQTGFGGQQGQTGFGGQQGQVGFGAQQGQTGFGGQQGKFILDNYQQPSTSGVSFGNANNNFFNSNVMPVNNANKSYLSQNPNPISSTNSYNQFSTANTYLATPYQVPQTPVYNPPQPAYSQRPASSLQKPMSYLPPLASANTYGTTTSGLTSTYSAVPQHLHRPTEYNIGNSNIGNSNIGNSGIGNIGIGNSGIGIGGMVSTQGNLFPNPITTNTSTGNINKAASFNNTSASYSMGTTPATTTTNSAYTSNSILQLNKIQQWRNFSTTNTTNINKINTQFDKYKLPTSSAVPASSSSSAVPASSSSSAVPASSSSAVPASSSLYQIPTSSAFSKPYDASKQHQSLFTPPSLLQSLTQPKAPLPYPYNVKNNNNITSMDFKYGSTFSDVNNYGMPKSTATSTTQANTNPVTQANTNPVAQANPGAQVNTNPVVNSYTNYTNINQGIGISLKQYKPSNQGSHKQSSPSSANPQPQAPLHTNPSILPTQSLQQQINTVQSNHPYADANSNLYQDKQYNDNYQSARQEYSPDHNNVGDGAQQPRNSQQPQFVIETFKQGSRYQGYKLKDMRHGHGKFYYQDGGMYDGNWSNNKMDGFGSLYYQSGQLAYQGMWKEDQFQGKGKLYNEYPFNLQDIFDYTNFDTIDQFWSYYEGDFVEDFKKGKGTLMLSNGEYFEGTFDNDMVEGPGAFHCKDGRVIKGIWKQNHLVSQ